MWSEMGKEKKPPKLTKDNRVYALECPAPYKLKLLRIRDESGTFSFSTVWFCHLHIRGRIRSENIPVWSCLRRFWIRNLKRELLNPKTFESGKFCRVNAFLSNPDIFRPAIFWVCGITIDGGRWVAGSLVASSFWRRSRQSFICNG